jgi:hypothetical protein
MKTNHDARFIAKRKMKEREEEKKQITLKSYAESTHKIIHQKEAVSQNFKLE